MVSVDEPEVLIVVGLKVPLAPAGKPSTDSVTTPAKLFVPVTVTVKFVPSPPIIVCDNGKGVIEKSGWTMVTLSKVTVLRAALSCEQTARPASALVERLTAVMLE